MSDIKRDKIARSLKSKGFVFDKGHGDHDWYYYVHNGKQYRHICAKLSRGSGYKTYGEGLLRRMILLLRLDTLGEVKRLFECPMDAVEYKAILKRKNQI